MKAWRSISSFASALAPPRHAAGGAPFRYAPGVTDVVLAGENAANKLGAQDVRVLFSVNSGRTLQPFSRLIEKSADPLQVYVAVRRLNYWAESFAMLSERPIAHIERGQAVRSQGTASSDRCLRPPGRAG